MNVNINTNRTSIGNSKVNAVNSINMNKVSIY